MQNLEQWFECKGTQKARCACAPGEKGLKLQVQFCLVVKSTMKGRSSKFFSLTLNKEGPLCLRFVAYYAK